MVVAEHGFVDPACCRQRFACRLSAAQPFVDPVQMLAGRRIFQRFPKGFFDILRRALVQLERLFVIALGVQQSGQAAQPGGIDAFRLFGVFVKFL